MLDNRITKKHEETAHYTFYSLVLVARRLPAGGFVHRMAVLVDGHGEMIWFVHEKGVLVDGNGEMIWFVHEKCVLVDGNEI